jgi:hypothetical protein
MYISCYWNISSLDWMCRLISGDETEEALLDEVEETSRNEIEEELVNVEQLRE